MSAYHTDEVLSAAARLGQLLEQQEEVFLVMLARVLLLMLSRMADFVA